MDLIKRLLLEDLDLSGLHQFQDGKKRYNNLHTAGVAL